MLPWSNNYTDQLYAWDYLKSQLLNRDAELKSKTRQTVILTQSTAPSTAQWEVAWVEQTGYALPIAQSAELIWVNNNSIAAIYRVLQNGTIIENSPTTPKRGVYTLSAVNGAATSSSTVFFTTPTLTIGTNIVVDRVSWLELGISGYLNVVTPPTPATAVFGIDFYANGVKLSTQYFNNGASSPYMFIGRESAYINVWMLIPNFAPGTYTFTCGIGNTGTPTAAGTWNLSASWNAYIKGYKL